MLIVGIILTVLGGISLIYGLIQLLGETSAIINFANQLGAGITNPGLVWLIIGIVVAIIGGLFS